MGSEGPRVQVPGHQQPQDLVRPPVQRQRGQAPLSLPPDPFQIGSDRTVTRWSAAALMFPLQTYHYSKEMRGERRKKNTTCHVFSGRKKFITKFSAQQRGGKSI